MKDYCCDICSTCFEKIEAKEYHEKIPVLEMDSDFFVLKNKKKYFMFTNSGDITRKHSILYSGLYFYKNLVELKKTEEFKLKHIQGKMPASEIEKKLESKEFERINAKEYEKIFSFLSKKYGKVNWDKY